MSVRTLAFRFGGESPTIIPALLSPIEDPHD